MRGSLAAIESARSQVDVLSRFLTRVNAHASRVALLVLRNDRLTGWKALGFDASGGRDEAVRTLDLGVEDDPFVAIAAQVAALRARRAPERVRPAPPRSRRTGARAHAPRPDGDPRPARGRRLRGRAPGRGRPAERGRRRGPHVRDRARRGPPGRAQEDPLSVPHAHGRGDRRASSRRRVPAARGRSRLRGRGRRLPPPSAPLPFRRPLAALAVDRRRRSPARDRGVGEDADPAGHSVLLVRSRAHEPDSHDGRAFPSPAPSPAAPPTPSRASPRSAAAPRFPRASRSRLLPFVPAPAVPPRRRLPLRFASGARLASPLSNASTGDFTGAFEALRASGRVAAARGEATSPAQKPARASTSAVTPPRDLADCGAADLGLRSARPRGRPRDSPQRAHDDARRLARLLISEIKLYNEKKVEEGRAPERSLRAPQGRHREKPPGVRRENARQPSARTRTSSTTSSCASSPTVGPRRSAR